jgi:pimeloyl-ACP methyl ester carboxylesterase
MSDTAATPGLTLPGVTHHRAKLDGVELHYAAGGTGGSPILLVHGWPETWWAFRGLMPLLAASHRVYAVDLRGFGDSSKDARADYGEDAFAEDLHQLVAHLDVGPVHLLCQDISGGLAVTFAARHPEDVLSFTGVETTLAGFALERLADVNNGGSWHVGFLGTPGIPELMIGGHERDLLGWAYDVMGSTAEAVTPTDLDEFVRGYTGPDAWHGAAGLYRSLFTDAGSTRTLLAAHPLTMPVLAVDGPSHPLTADTLRQVAVGEFAEARIDGVGHLVAQEAPDELADVVLRFISGSS